MHQLDVVVAVVEGVVGEDLLGLYLHGSAVRDELRPASDLDLLAVTRRSLDREGRAELCRRLSGLSGPAHGLRSVDLATVVLDEVVPWAYPARCDFRWGDWLRAEVAAGLLPEAGPSPGLAVELAQVLAGDRALLGPPPAELLDPTPAADVARGGRDGIPELLAGLPGDTRNVLLTLARVWLTVATGEVRPKDEAASWALRRLEPEHRAPLEHARDLYLTTTYADETWPNGLHDEAGPTVERLVARIAAEA